ncbi:MAG: hypothetical protein Q8O37_16895 [Sulfuricellaceae bacterium]|nr:hypothetical protein [Sulfuricellaceae bacterium]
MDPSRIGRGWKGQTKPAPGDPDQGWDYNPADSQDEVLAGLVQKRLAACVKTFASGGSPKNIECLTKAANDFSRGLIAKQDDNGGMGKLTNYQNAFISERKLSGYALNPDHPTGGNKARRIKAALGFDSSNSGEIMSMILRALKDHDAVEGAANAWGRVFTVDIPLTGPAGNAIVRTAWILENGQDVPKLTSFYVKDS